MTILSLEKRTSDAGKLILNAEKLFPNPKKLIPDFNELIPHPYQSHFASKGSISRFNSLRSEPYLLVSQPYETSPLPSWRRSLGSRSRGSARQERQSKTSTRSLKCFSFIVTTCPPTCWA